ncbi:hypothetical protein WCE10_21380 [Cronobacter muytjensii]|uniref:hypothetical protein n=1 Tax=Cronobacter muytjensii TaxID=413501 RepID=UPI0034D45CDD
MSNIEDKIYSVLFNNFSGVVGRDALKNIAKEITSVSAAPELLEALQMIIAACDACGKDDDKSLIDEFTQEMEDKARAAIEKATGNKNS